jgi:hypothetical protein
MFSFNFSLAAHRRGPPASRHPGKALIRLTPAAFMLMGAPWRSRLDTPTPIPEADGVGDTIAGLRARLETERRGVATVEVETARLEAQIALYARDLTCLYNDDEGDPDESPEVAKLRREVHRLADVHREHVDAYRAAAERRRFLADELVVYGRDLARLFAERPARRRRRYVWWILGLWALALLVLLLGRTCGLPPDATGSAQPTADPPLATPTALSAAPAGAIVLSNGPQPPATPDAAEIAGGALILPDDLGTVVAADPGLVATVLAVGPERIETALASHPEVRATALALGPRGLATRVAADPEWLPGLVGPTGMAPLRTPADAGRRERCAVETLVPPLTGGASYVVRFTQQQRADILAVWTQQDGDVALVGAGAASGTGTLIRPAAPPGRYTLRLTGRGTETGGTRVALFYDRNATCEPAPVADLG